MSWQCQNALEYVSDFLKSESGGREMRALMERSAHAREIADVLIERCRDAELAALMRYEFSELPDSFVMTFMNAWLMAAEAGREFLLVSRRPERPVEYARSGRVSFTLNHDESGIEMAVSHIHRRHAEWYKPRTLAAV